jgi:general stress protein 26
MCECCNTIHTNELEKVKNYIKNTKYATLGYVSTTGVPSLRAMGSFDIDELNLYFSSSKTAEKVSNIAVNPTISFLFQHEGQELATFKNVTYVGIAKEIKCETEYNKAVKILSEKSPRFKERAQKGQLGDTAIFKVVPKSIKYLDYSNGIGPNAVKEIEFANE